MVRIAETYDSWHFWCSLNMHILEKAASMNQIMNCQRDVFFIKRKKEEIWLGPMTKAPTPTENPKSNVTTQRRHQNLDYTTIRKRFFYFAWVKWIFINRIYDTSTGDTPTRYPRYNLDCHNRFHNARDPLPFSSWHHPDGYWLILIWQLIPNICVNILSKIKTIWHLVLIIIHPFSGGRYHGFVMFIKVLVRPGLRISIHPSFCQSFLHFSLACLDVLN